MDESAPELSGADPSLELPHLEDQLNLLMTRVDQEQDCADELVRAVKERQIQVDELRQQFTKIHKLRRARHIAVADASRLSSGVDDSGLEGEHADFIRAKRNGIIVLTDLISKIKAEVDPLEAEFRDLHQIQGVLLCESARVKKKVQRMTSQRTQLDHDAQLTQEQMRELKHSLLGRGRLLKDAELFHAGLLQRFSSVHDDNNEKSGIPLSIKGIDGSIYQCEAQIDEIKQEVEIIDELCKNRAEGQAAELGRLMQLANWQAERQLLTDRFEGAKAELAAADAEFQKARTILKEGEERYEKLGPLVAKRKLPDDPGDIETDLDDLFRMLATRISRGDQGRQNDAAQRDSLAIRNGDLEARVAKRRDELQRSIRKFGVDEVRLKQMVRDSRTQTATREQKIVAQIEKVKRKLAPAHR
jgi:hypothetical protein